MQKINFEDAPSRRTPINSTNLNAMQTNAENAINEAKEEVLNVELIAVTDTAPTTCSTGDKYFNTTDNLIYTATGTDTWSSTGESPIEGIFYIVFEEQTTYAYDGTTLISVGGGAGGGGDNEPIGKVVPMVLETAPDGYLLCDGSTYTKAAYPDLYKALVGTQFIIDTNSFRVPDIKGKVIVGKDSNDTDFDTLGETGGSKTDDLSNAYAKATLESDGNSTLLRKQKSVSSYSTNKYTNGGTGGAGGNLSRTPTNATELGGTVSRLQPYIVLNYFIKAQKLSGDVVLSESLPVGTEVDFDGQTSDIPVGWEQVGGKTLVAYGLYSNSTGTNGDVTLSDNPTNYDLLIIKHKNNDSGDFYSETIVKPMLNQVFTFTRVEVTSNQAYLFAKNYTISSNKLTAGTAYLLGIHDNSYSTYNNIRIVEVLGYKEA